MHMIYFTGMKYAVLDYFSRHPTFNHVVWYDYAVFMMQVAWLSAQWLSAHSEVHAMLMPSWKIQSLYLLHRIT